MKERLSGIAPERRKIHHKRKKSGEQRRKRRGMREGGNRRRREVVGETESHREKRGVEAASRVAESSHRKRD